MLFHDLFQPVDMMEKLQESESAILDFLHLNFQPAAKKK